MNFLKTKKSDERGIAFNTNGQFSDLVAQSSNFFHKRVKAVTKNKAKD
jgi:hypothetical protein